MQSGISASEELQSAFRSLLSSSTDRGLLAGISSSPESLIAGSTVKSTTADFAADLDNLSPLIKDNAAAYIILREEVAPGAAKCVAITYVPERAPVRQKMLFASTRLTLTRELGTEHFSSTLFATAPSELTPAGWKAHLAHSSLSAPLTDEEQSLASIREAEAQESMGTSARSGGHVSKNITLPIADDAASALAQLKEGQLGLVMLAINVSTESLTLVGTADKGLGAGDLSSKIAQDEPRYSFYRHEDSGKNLFVYTCPSVSSIKQRMLYAASRRSTISLLAPKHGLDIAGKLEATDPEDITETSILEELGVKGAEDGAASANKSGFARPKRPGRR